MCHPLGGASVAVSRALFKVSTGPPKYHAKNHQKDTYIFMLQ